MKDVEVGVNDGQGVKGDAIFFRRDESEDDEERRNAEMRERIKARLAADAEEALAEVVADKTLKEKMDALRTRGGG